MGEPEVSELRRRQRCVTCTPSEWRAIRAKARAAGMDTSAWILSRVLDGEAPDGPPNSEAGYPLALTRAEQRRQLELLEHLVEDSRRFLDEPVMPGTGATLREAVAFLILSCGIDGSANRTGPVNRPANEIRAGSGPETLTAVESETGPGREMRTAEDPDLALPTEGIPLQGDFLDDLVAGPNRNDGQ